MASSSVNENAPLLGAEDRSLVGGDTMSSSVTTIAAPEFDPEGDSDNPLEWSKPFKSFIVFLLAMSAFTVYVAPCLYVHQAASS